MTKKETALLYGLVFLLSLVFFGGYIYVSFNAYYGG